MTDHLVLHGSFVEIVGEKEKCQETVVVNNSRRCPGKTSFVSVLNSVV